MIAEQAKNVSTIEHILSWRDLHPKNPFDLLPSSWDNPRYLLTCTM